MIAITLSTTPQQTEGALTHQDLSQTKQKGRQGSSPNGFVRILSKYDTLDKCTPSLYVLLYNRLTVMTIPGQVTLKSRRCGARRSCRCGTSRFQERLRIPAHKWPILRVYTCACRHSLDMQHGHSINFSWRLWSWQGLSYRHGRQTCSRTVIGNRQIKPAKTNKRSFVSFFSLSLLWNYQGTIDFVGFNVPAGISRNKKVIC